MNTSISSTLENKENHSSQKKRPECYLPIRKFGTELSHNQGSLSSSSLTNPSDSDCYANEIYSYLHSIESQNTAGPGFLKIQVDINEKMRGILID